MNVIYYIMATKTTLTILAITSAVIYMIIWSIGCSPMVVYTHETFQRVGIDSEIALADVDGKDFGHTYVLVNGEPVEPRYLGLYLQDNINYDEPYETYKSTDDFTNAGYPIFPGIDTIISAIEGNF